MIWYQKLILSLLGVSLAYASNPSVSNTLKFGDGTATNKLLVFNRNQGGLNPTIRWNESGQQLEFSNDGTNYSGIGSGSGSGAGGFNLISTNPGFENGVSLGWSATGSEAFLPVTSGANLLFGKGSATFQTFGVGQMSSSLYTVPNGLLGQGCQAQVYYKGADNTLTLSVIDASSNILASVPFVASATPTTLNLPFMCPTVAATQIQLKISGTVSSALVALDQMYLGSQQNLINIAQAQYLGSVTIGGAGCSGFSNTTTGNTPVPFSAGSGCTYTLSGSLQPPATPQTPGFLIPSVGAGEIQIVAESYFENHGNAANGIGYWNMFDGTNTSSTQAMGFAISLSSAVAPINNLLEGSFIYSTPQTNVTYEIQSTVAVGDHTAISAGQFTPLNFDVFYFPTTPQTAYNAATVNWHVDATYSSVGNIGNFGPGYPLGGGTLTANSGSIAVQVPCSGTNPPQTGNCTSGTSEPGISFYLPVPGQIQVCFSEQLQIEASNQNGQIQYSIDQTANSDDSSVIQAGNVQGEMQAYVTTSFIANGQFVRTCQNFNENAVGQITFRENMLGSGSSDNNVGTSYWTVYPTNQQIPAPVLLNQIVSSNANVEVINRVKFGGTGTAAAPTDCVTSPCVVYSQSGSWVSSVTRSSTGVYIVNFPGVYGDIPSCMCVPVTNSGFVCDILRAPTGPTSSSVTIQVYASPTAIGEDTAIDVFCMGPAAAP